MRSSRNFFAALDNFELGCNRLENAVKPQPRSGKGVGLVGCNRLENAVKPQPTQLLT